MYTLFMERDSKRWWDFWSAALVLSLLWVASRRLELTEWTEHLGVAMNLALLGAFLGFALGYSRFSRWGAFIYGLAMTVFAVPWQLGLVLGERVEWRERIFSLGGRLGTSLYQFANNIPLKDSLLFLASMGLVFWLFGLLAGYRLTRRGAPYAPLLFAGLALLLIEYYQPDNRRALFSAVFALLLLMLLARIHYLNSRNEWLKTRIIHEPELGFDVGRGALIGALLLVMVAWTLPDVIEAFRPGSQKNQVMVDYLKGLSDSFGNITAPLKGTSRNVVYEYGDSMGLDTGSKLSDEPLFRVRVTPDEHAGDNYYWAVRSYDRYENGSWETSDSNYDELTASATLVKYPEWKARRELLFTFELQVEPGRKAFFVDMPVSFSRPSIGEFLPVPQGGREVVSIQPKPSLNPGDQYRVRSLVSVPTIRQMRSDSGQYPEWVAERYLALPVDFPPSVRALAEQITAGLPGAYDKALAITRYLRETIEYQEVIDSPPEGRDPVEWFLLDYQKGFCKYYASAEVLMLRSLGIPARLVVGYAAGEFNEDDLFYQVRQKDSHAWPEVYFADLGWVEFEPTVAQPERYWPSGEPSAAANRGEAGGEDPFAGDFSEQRYRRNERTLRDDELPEPLPQKTSIPLPTPAPAPPVRGGWWVLMGVTAVIVAAYVGYEARRRKNPRLRPVSVVLDQALSRRGLRVPGWLRAISQRAALTTMERLFLSVDRMLSLAGGRTKPNQTPAERVRLLVKRVPDAGLDAKILLDEYERAEYSPHPPDVNKARQAGRRMQWIVIQWRLARLLARPDELDSAV